MKKMLMLATTAAMIEQFNKNNILILEEMGYEVHVVGNWQEGNPISNERLEEFKKWLSKHHGKWFHIAATRKPMDFRNNGEAYHDVVYLVKEYKYEFIHCHTPIGSIIGRLVAKRTHTKIIYTAHGFHFFKGAPFKNWLLYFPAEWICSWMTDVLITINTEDYERAKKHLHANKTEYIPGVGVDTDQFSTGFLDKPRIRKELQLNSEDFVIISIGELNKNKNHEVIIDAIAKLNDSHIKYIICGQGALETHLRQKIKQYGLDKQVLLLGYRTDIKEMLGISNLFVFPSMREGLSVSLMEAMASGLPVICGNIRGNRDLIVDGSGGYLLTGNSAVQYANAIREMMVADSKREIMGRYNQAKTEDFHSKVVCAKMRQIYEWKDEQIGST